MKSPSKALRHKSFCDLGLEKLEETCYPRFKITVDKTETQGCKQISTDNVYFCKRTSTTERMERFSLRPTHLEQFLEHS